VQAGFVRPITHFRRNRTIRDGIYNCVCHRKQKKACRYRPFIHCAALHHECRKKAFEKNPITTKWVIVACVRKSYRVGFSDPSRPDFPEYGYRFFQIQAFLTSTAGVSPQRLLYQIPKQLSTKYKKIPTDCQSLEIFSI